jgi:hypothetical protein
MSKQGESQSSEKIVFLWLVAFVVFYYTAQYFAPYFLMVWKWIRVFELVPLMRFDIIKKVLTYDWLSYDAAFDYVNDYVWAFYRWLGIPLVAIGIYYQKYIQVDDWLMEHYLNGVYNRFPWLSIIYKPPTGMGFTKKMPFIRVGDNHEYLDPVFPRGMKPLDFLNKYRENLSDILKRQVGPLIRLKGNNIDWQDQWAKKIAEECYKLIPNKSSMPGGVTWRNEAWDRCYQTHRFERTFAIGMLSEARRFGVIAPAEFLWLRLEAGKELKKGNDSAFILWRGVCCFGGRCAFPESVGMLLHMLYEKHLTEYQKKHKNDAKIIYQMKGSPWVFNAVAAFFELEKMVLSSPDSVKGDDDNDNEE